MGRQGARNEFKGFHADNRRFKSRSLTLSISGHQRENRSVKTVNVCQGSLKIQSTHPSLVGVILDGEANYKFQAPNFKFQKGKGIVNDDCYWVVEIASLPTLLGARNGFQVQHVLALINSGCAEVELKVESLRPLREPHIRVSNKYANMQITPAAPLCP